MLPYAAKNTSPRLFAEITFLLLGCSMAQYHLPDPPPDFGRQKKPASSMIA